MNASLRHLEPPRRRSECPPRSEPCGRLLCRHHLWLDPVVDQHGAVVDLRESGAFEDICHTCALRQAAHGPKTLEEIGSILNVSRERVRQIEAEALARLRDADPGVLRELLDAINAVQSDGEPWEENDHEPLCCDATTGEAGEEPTTDESGAPEGADDPVSDNTGSPPWSEPTSTDPRIAAVNQQRIERANARAAEARPFWCPHCGRECPGITIDGKPRRTCSNPRCRARAWGDHAREQGRYREGIAPEVVAAIRTEYRPGEHGYRALAREHGLPVATVSSILRRANREEG